MAQYYFAIPQKQIYFNKINAFRQEQRRKIKNDLRIRAYVSILCPKFPPNLLIFSYIFRIEIAI